MASGTVFSETQVGRFGNLILNHFNLQISNNPDPDQQAVHLIASDGRLPNPRPTIQEILRLKGMSDYDRDPAWQQWLGQFSDILKRYPRLTPLTPQCRARSRFFGSPAECWHDVIPPLTHYNLRGFQANELPSLSDNVGERNGGDVYIQRNTRSKWIYIVTLEGEIILASEDYNIINHVCISGGRFVWSAGEVGVKNNKIQIVNLKTGHYIRPTSSNRMPSIPDLANFTKEVFIEYSMHWGIRDCLYTGFYCQRAF